jgi:hypothetical protein
MEEGFTQRYKNEEGTDGSLDTHAEPADFSKGPRIEEIVKELESK